MQGLPGWGCVLLRPLKNQPPPSPFFFPFNLQVPTSCWSPRLPVVFLQGLLLFVLRQTQLNPHPPTPSCFPSSLLSAWRPSLPREAAVGSREDEHGWMRRGGDQHGLLLAASRRELLSPALHLGLFMKWLSHSKQCHIPGLGSPSDV